MFHPEAFPIATTRAEKAKEEDSNIASPFSREYIEAESLVPTQPEITPSLTPSTNPEILSSEEKDRLDEVVDKAMELRAEQHARENERDFDTFLVAERQMIHMFEEELAAHTRHQTTGNSEISPMTPRAVSSASERSNSDALGNLLEKMRHIPGGKALLGAMTLVIGLSALPQRAEAQSRNDDLLEKIWRNAERTTENAVQRETNRAVTGTINEVFRGTQRSRENERFEQQYLSQINREIASFKNAFDNVSFRKFPSSDDRDRALLQIASQTLHNLERYDNDFIVRTNANLDNLSLFSQKILKNFMTDVKTGVYHDKQWVDNPLQNLPNRTAEPQSRSPFSR